MGRHDRRRRGRFRLQRLLLDAAPHAGLAGGSRNAGPCSKGGCAYRVWRQRRHRRFGRLSHRRADSHVGLAPVAHAVCGHRICLGAFADSGRVPIQDGQRAFPTLLSVIAGMVDLTGFLNLGNLFTAHITGNLVAVAALVVRGGRINPAQILAIPVFMLAVAATWLLARASGRRGPGLLRLLLLVQFLLLTCGLIFSVITKPSANPDGLIGCIAAMMAVSAMACQFALLRVGLPVAPSTAVLTGNLTNAVQS